MGFLIYRKFSDTLSPGTMESTESPWCKLYLKLKGIHDFDYLNLSIVGSNGFTGVIYETAEILREIRKMFILISLNYSG